MTGQIASQIGKQRLWIFSVLPAAILNIGGLLLFGLGYGLAAARRVPLSQVEQDRLLFSVYALVFLVEGLLVLALLRRERCAGRPLVALLAPGGMGRAGRLRWDLALGVFGALNGLFIAYVALEVAFRGAWPSLPTLVTWQRLFLVIAVPLQAAFCEELVWRGYLISQYEARGYAPGKAVLLAAISFACIHGVYLPSKLAVTFLFGLIAGFYYVRERNLWPLMLAHLCIDVWSFALTVWPLW